MVPLGIQLHTVKEAAEQDYAGTLARVAAIGYKGVETANLYGQDPADVRRMVEDLGMTVIAPHIGPAIPYSPAELVDMAGALGTDTIVCAVWEQAQWETMADVQRIAAAMQEAAGQLSPHGIRLAYHNHRFEMPIIEGKTALEHFYALAPDVPAEIDIYWASNYGRIDVPPLVRNLADRTILLHLKDGSMLESDGKMLTAIGSGKLDIPPIVAAADPDVLEWNIVEIDRTEGDIWDAVRDSYEYITSAGLAAGAR